MPTFKAWRKKTVDKIERRQNTVLNRFISEMELVMESAVDFIVSHYQATGRFKEPSLTEMFRVSEKFYRGVISSATKTCEETKGKQKKRLAKLPGSMPRGSKKVKGIFGNPRYWSRILKRSQKLTEKLRKQYIAKLQDRFEQLIPEIQKGNIDPRAVKTHMMEAWKASKPRVETIFRTETTNYFAKTQTAFFANDDEIIGFLFDSIRDSARTIICRDRHGLVYRPGTKELLDNTPALHYNCRSHLIALANTPENRKLLEDPQRNPKNRKVAPLPPGWKK